jgi:protocatechuate 3,4-dioxygenase beta subunit
MRQPGRSAILGRQITKDMRPVLVLVLLLLGTPALAQTPGAPVITGRVVAAATGVPLRRARVELTGRNAALPSLPTSSSPSEPVLTDDDGRFSIEVRGVLGPTVSLLITKGGYVTAAPVIRRENVGTPIELRLARGAAITGIVLNLQGAPVQGYAVTVRRVDANPERDGAPAEYLGTTDDHGEYRVGGLLPGTYTVAAGSAMIIREIPPGCLEALEQVARLGQPPAGALECARQAQTREAGLGAVVQVRLGTGDEVGGVQLLAPRLTGVEEMRLAQSRMVTPGEQIAPPRGSAARVRGRVLTADRRPVHRAVVRVTGAASIMTISTDEDGGYEARGLRAGRYTVEVTVNQMVWRLGQERVGQSGRQITVATDQVVEGIDVVLPAARAIYGAVVDEHGEPVQGARVQALLVQYAGDRLVSTPVGVDRRTDDRGNYRLWGLYGGTYLVSASINGVVSGRAPGQSAYTTLYYPGSPNVAGAQRVDLREDTIASIAFGAVTLSEVRGVALDGDAPLVAGRTRLIEAREQGLVSLPRNGTIRPDGTFVIPHVPPGNYVLQVLGDGPGRTGLFATLPVSVGAAPVQVSVKTSHGTAVEGRLVLEGAAEQSRPAFQVAAVALDDRARTEATSAVIGSSEFFLTGLFGPTAFTLKTSAEDWFLKSFIINGADISDTGFDFGARPATITDTQLVLSRNGASVSGKLRESTPSNYFVVAFPTSREHRFAYSRRVKFARSGADGEFRIGGLPPGSYFVAAVDYLDGTADGGEWQNPELLLRLESGAERITLLEGQAGTVSLRLNQR